MTEEEQRIVQKWKRRAKIFKDAYREAELAWMDALNSKIESDFKLLQAERRIAELEAKPN